MICSNNKPIWNDAWYKQLRKQANYVLKNRHIKNLDPDDLVNVAWIRSVRYLDPSVEIIIYTKRIRCFMYDYLNTREKSFGRSLLDDNEITCEHLDFTAIESNEFIDYCLSSLNDYDRRLIRMRYIVGLSPKEIGILVCESRETVSSKIQTALRRIRVSLNESSNTAYTQRLKSVKR